MAPSWSHKPLEVPSLKKAQIHATITRKKSTQVLTLLFSGEINHMKPGEMVQFSCDSNLEHYKNFRRQKVSCRKLNHTRTTETQIS